MSVTYKYVGPTLLQKQIESMCSNGHSIFHRVEEIAIQRLPVPNPEALAELKNLTRLRLTMVEGVDPDKIRPSLFPESDLKSRRPAVEIAVNSKWTSSAD